MNLALEGLEKERDFYFSKLRDVEVLCQEHESDDLPIVKQILDILYATEVSLADCFVLFRFSFSFPFSVLIECVGCFAVLLW